MQTDELEHATQLVTVALQSTHFKFPEVESIQTDAAKIVKYYI